MLRVDACPKCDTLGYVIDSRHSTGVSQHIPSISGLAYRRKRYECGACSHRWSTFELRDNDLWAKLVEPPKPKQVSALGLDAEEQKALIAQMQRRAPREAKPEKDPTRLWCGHDEAQQQVDENGVEWCPSCSARTA